MEAIAMPAADPNDVIRALMAQDLAVAVVGERLRTAVAGWCPNRGWSTDIIVQTESQYGTDYRSAAKSLLGIGRYPTVTYVVPAGAADRAGVRTGDEIVAVDGETMPIAQGGAARMTETDRAIGIIDRAMQDGEVAFSIRRQGKNVTIPVLGRMACRVAFEVRAGDGGNANATVDRIQISSDLADPARAEQTIAPLLAHELAHVILRHPERLRDRSRGLLPGFGRNGAALRASEIAADRMSVYILASAGYRPADAIAFWSDFGKRSDLGILSDRTHPGWRARVEAITREAARVSSLQTEGAPIEPPPDLFSVTS